MRLIHPAAWSPRQLEIIEGTAFCLAVLLSTVGSIITFLAVTSPQAQDRGIAVFELNITRLFPSRISRSDDPLWLSDGMRHDKILRKDALRGRSVLSRLESKVKSAATAVKSAASSIESDVQNKINRTTAGEAIPNGISFGTQRVCIELANGTNTCYKFPVEVVKLLPLPGPLRALLKDDVGGIQNLQGQIVKLLRVANHLIAAAAILMMFVYKPLFTSLTCIKAWRRQNFTRIKQSSNIALATVSAMLLAYPVTALWLIHGKIEGLFSPAIKNIIRYAGGPVKDYVLSSMIIFIAASAPTYVVFWARHKKNTIGQGEYGDDAGTQRLASGLEDGTDSVQLSLKSRISAPILEHAGPRRLTGVTDSVLTIARESHVQVGRVDDLNKVCAMEPAQIIAAVNKQNSALEQQVSQLYGEIEHLQSQLQFTNQAFQTQQVDLSCAYEQLFVQREFEMYLHSYIAHLVSRSQGAIHASQQTTEFFESRLATAKTWTSKESPNISQEIAELNQKVLTMIKVKAESEDHTRRLQDIIIENESTISLKQTENNKLQDSLRKNKKRLDQHQRTASALITTRDDLNRKLAHSNDALRTKAGKAKKVTQTLRTKLKETEAALETQTEQQADLSMVIEEQETLQIQQEAELMELRRVKEFYRLEDMGQAKTITSLKNHVKELEAGQEAKKISKLESEIMHLKMQQERTELELDKQKKLFSKSMDSAKNLQQRATEAEKEVVTCRGHALSITKTLLDSMQEQSGIW
ncbi:hypothetical protein PMIN01_13460 [Paraphaeosphaeria minitans]|uniref:Uncharacterized protein n=1 Tax=Paraphaeosphaeria minitans TaxID=565426 RepID=A0A9P6KJC6_9PLEO|nr:hypothetical protein PMIN01_13460 [Paraphaeosphaeria minitans]